MQHDAVNKSHHAVITALHRTLEGDTAGRTGAPQRAGRVKLFGSDEDVHDATTATRTELDGASLESEQRVVLAAAHVRAGWK
jgi:hypothetical protein